ncbi:MAG: translation initiation factor [Edaphocola sp.]
MAQKKFNSLSGLVFSTNPDALRPPEPESVGTWPPAEQKLVVRIEKKHRAGKTVTAILGFEGNDGDLQDLAKKLKTKCGTGGTAKDAEILIQGDYREKIIAWLKEWGYKNTKG